MAGKEEYAWRDMSVVAAGRTITEIQSVQYTVNRNLEANYGAGDDPHSIQKGNKDYPIEIGMNQSEIEAMNRSAKAQGAEDLTDISFDVVVHYAKNIGDPRVTDILRGVSVGSLPKGWNQGDTKMVINLTGMALKIEYDV